MIFKLDLKKFLISIAIPLSVGGISALIVHGNTDIYSKINQPPLAPPSWVFPVVWTVLYLLMGISLYIIWNTHADSGKKRLAFIFFGIQLFLNLIWSPIFFGLQLFLPALIVLVFTWIFTAAMIVSFYAISKPAALLQIPYIIWLTFAGYLNFAIYLLN